MKLSISVMAHPSRKENFEYLQTMLGDVPFSIDLKSEGEWTNCKRAWMMYDPQADWHVVIQDDAIICKDFTQKALDVIQKSNDIIKEDHICNFYFGRNRISTPVGDKAIKVGYWINGYPKWGVAICIPTKYIKEMIKFCNSLDSNQHGTRDDSRIAKFCGHKKLKVYFPMPSIVDHRHGPSLVGDPGQKRGAYQFIDQK